ncbi:hypothetical protein [Burkholderia sp. MBR-1]|uniref:hypothetical protein n=1 Tax=Burkholderia sp. MBR-1 TaxID=2732364 RepID=UPI0015EEFDBC|nr:hypothetical protein [Burkholderia sp. MBR-1]QMI49892.1 hypothetical protein MBR110_31015 [Burkholderia sp. MBR-1]
MNRAESMVQQCVSATGFLRASTCEQWDGFPYFGSLMLTSRDSSTRKLKIKAKEGQGQFVVRLPMVAGEFHLSQVDVKRSSSSPDFVGRFGLFGDSRISLWRKGPSALSLGFIIKAPVIPKVSLPEFYAMLENHDWYSGFSDDYRTQELGEDRFAQLTAIAEADAEKRKLLDAFRLHHFSGEAWNTPKAEKPLLPGAILA